MDNKDRVHLPTTIIIFGATGDLFRKKIIKSLLRLHALGYLPEEFNLIALSRRDYSDHDYKKFLMDNVLDSFKQDYSSGVINKFLGNISYFKGDFKDRALYSKLKKTLLKKRKRYM